MEVERGWVFLLLPMIGVLMLILQRKSFFGFPSLDLVPKDWGGRMASFFTGIVPMFLLIMLLSMAAGLRTPEKEQLKYGYGADIVFILDESTSMAESLEAYNGPVNRLHPPEESSKFYRAKADIAKFMEKRKAGRDRYGLTVFGSTAVRVLPLSFNHSLFLSSLEAQECILSSTVISSALALGLDELTRSDTRSRMLILVSDGGGTVQDEKYGFSKIIRDEGIRVYWIALGADNFDEVPQFLRKIGPLGKRIDAENVSQLEAAFTEIHKLEPSLILYRSSSRAFSPSIFVYSAFILMALIWIADSLFVYRRNT